MTKFELGDRVRLASEYRLRPEMQLGRSDRARGIPIGHGGAVFQTSDTAHGHESVIVVNWDDWGQPGNRNLRIHESCLELELDDDEVDDAVQSILKSMKGEQ